MHTATVPPLPPVPLLTGLGQALRWLRERQARKQYQVAAAAGITKGMLSAYETGRQRPSLETLDKLLETLGCDLNDLHNALQIVNGRPEQMKGWGAYGSLGSYETDRSGAAQGQLGMSAGTFPLPPLLPPALLAQGLPSFGELCEPGAPGDLHRVLGLPDRQSPGLHPEEEAALVQMLEGFHSLLRYWHRRLAALAGAGPAGPSGLGGPEGPASPAGQGGHAGDRGDRGQGGPSGPGGSAGSSGTAGPSRPAGPARPPSRPAGPAGSVNPARGTPTPVTPVTQKPPGTTGTQGASPDFPLLSRAGPMRRPAAGNQATQTTPEAGAEGRRIG